MHELEIGGFRFDVPPKYRVADNMPLTARDREALDHSDDALLAIPMSELGASPNPPSMDRRSTILLYLIATDGTEVAHRGAIEAWQKSGLYSTQIVEAEPTGEFFRIYSQHAYPVYWQEFRGDPNSRNIGEDPKSRWIASCTGKAGSARTPLNEADCLTYMQWKSLLAEISIPGSLLEQTDQLKAKISYLLDSWSKQ